VTRLAGLYENAPLRFPARASKRFNGERIIWVETQRST
jgi:hypothetical protein